MNSPNLSDEYLGKILKDRFWIWESEIRKLMLENTETQFLSGYQWALSLFAEHMQDTKRKIIVSYWILR